MEIPATTGTTLQPDTRFVIADGIKMPIIGFGTFQLEPGEETERSVLLALEHGYRLIDTAAIYNNEKEVGSAIRKSGIPREEIFVTTKLWNDAHGRNKAKEAFQRSLDALQTSYIDLYLIHWPESGALVETWQSLIELANGGECRSIGVSNFEQDHINQIVEATSVVPSVNQIKFNVYEYPRELTDYCFENNIAVEAYSPIAQGKYGKDSRLESIAGKYGRSIIQVMLRWALQKGTIVIPRSSKEEHISENIDLFGFELSDEDIMKLDTIGES
ncbi:MAG: aldo/keto reductase [Chitinivibrionales bacterium]|nr:aldo/keto reductase [Chitinivibrionales bacterium]